MMHWHQYRGFLHHKFAWLASATMYIAIVLTVMRVRLATDALQDNDAFQPISYGFTVVSILGPLIAIGLVLVAFCYIFVGNWAATVVYREKRFHNIRALSGEA